ncbi:hypothetical protein GN958_ATG19877 [Phytophthora infestans]|uniref:Uncharacterized protein n=1 Tax=Phytophthora infestans TaxID=4787 RepID=A0A8S9TTK7_PHYIN|nr:hypothetical protein GN958_ATG19877 [Phytophthora infestans]
MTASLAFSSVCLTSIILFSLMTPLLLTTLVTGLLFLSDPGLSLMRTLIKKGQQLKKLSN